jgi:AraC-like DNA-binding protein
MLEKSVLLDEGGLRLEDVRCASRRTGWSSPEPSTSHTVVFVRRGCFRRRVDGVEMLLDPNVVYFESPGEEQEIAHPADGGDACTFVWLEESFLCSIAASGELPRRPIFTTAAVDLQHRSLLTECYNDADAFAATEATARVVAGVLESAAPERVSSARPTTERARRRIVDGAREALAADTSLTLIELARQLAVSPHHLSRVFSALTGETISAYRNRVRVRLALERLSQGERSIARVAADLGFSDHAHLARVVRREVGRPPSELRAALEPAA